MLIGNFEKISKGNDDNLEDDLKKTFLNNIRCYPLEWDSVSVWVGVGRWTLDHNQLDF